MNAKQRLALFYGTTVTSQQALQMSDADIHYACMKAYACDIHNCLSIIPIRTFYERGCDIPYKLMDLGMDSLDLLDSTILRELICVYGVASVRDCFVSTHEDAVCIAGTEACDLLQTSLELLLTLCANRAHSAELVLSSIPNVNIAIMSVPISTLVNTGVDAACLRRVGITLNTLTDTMHASAADLNALGVKFM